MFNAVYCGEKGLHEMSGIYGGRLWSARKRYRKAWKTMFSKEEYVQQMGRAERL